MAARVNSSTNILARSSQEAFKADALTQKKCMLFKDPMKPVKPFSDCAQRRLNVQPDHDIPYHPSVYKVLRSSAVGEKGSDPRHAIKCNSLCTTFYHCRYCGIHTDRSILAVIDSRKDNILDLKDGGPRLIIVLNPDEFVKDLKELDSPSYYPLPSNIMFAFFYHTNCDLRVNRLISFRAGGRGPRLTKPEKARFPRRTSTGCGRNTPRSSGTTTLRA
jgi:hypothetical protein